MADFTLQVVAPLLVLVGLVLVVTAVAAGWRPARWPAELARPGSDDQWATPDFPRVRSEDANPLIEPVLTAGDQIEEIARAC